jgi:hypothetical protein
LDGIALVVWSRKNHTTIPVTSISTGDVADVQTRRRDNLIEVTRSISFP